MGDLVVFYRETVAGTSSQTCFSKSPNMHNRIYFDAGSVTRRLTQVICQNHEVEFGWDEIPAHSVWCVGPQNEGANLVVDGTQGAQYLIEFKVHVNIAFKWVTKEGPRCKDNRRYTMQRHGRRAQSCCRQGCVA